MAETDPDGVVENDDQRRIEALERRLNETSPESTLEQRTKHIAFLLQIFGVVLAVAMAAMVVAAVFGVGSLEGFIGTRVDGAVASLLEERTELYVERATRARVVGFEREVQEQIRAIEADWRAAQRQVEQLSTGYAAAVESAQSDLALLDLGGELVLDVASVEQTVALLQRSLDRLHVLTGYDGTVGNSGEATFRSVQDALASGAKRIYVLPGTYPSPLVVNEPEVLIAGLPGQTFFNNSLNTGHPAGSIRADNVELTGLGFQTAPGGSGGNQSALVVEGNGVRLTRIAVQQADHNGIEIGGRVWLSDCAVRDADHVGLLVRSSSAQCRVMGVSATGAAGAVRIQEGATNTVVTACHIEGRIENMSRSTVMVANTGSAAK